MHLGKYILIYFVWCSSRQVRDSCALCISVKAVQSTGAGANPCWLQCWVQWCPKHWENIS